MRPRTQSKSAQAAITDRSEATCIPENAAILMAAPPVENRIAAAIAASTPRARFRPLIANRTCLQEPIILVIAFCVQPSPPGGTHYNLAETEALRALHDCCGRSQFGRRPPCDAACTAGRNRRVPCGGDTDSDRDGRRVEGVQQRR